MTHEFPTTPQAAYTEQEPDVDTRNYPDPDFGVNFSPQVLNAYADGLVPTHILERGLLIKAPTMQGKYESTTPETSLISS